MSLIRRENTGFISEYMKISATAAYVQELYLKSAENNGLALGVGFVSYEVIQMI